jgi:hypothetical protein
MCRRLLPEPLFVAGSELGQAGKKPTVRGDRGGCFHAESMESGADSDGVTNAREPSFYSRGAVEARIDLIGLEEALVNVLRKA